MRGLFTFALFVFKGRLSRASAFVRQHKLGTEVSVANGSGCDVRGRRRRAYSTRLGGFPGGWCRG